MRPRELAQAPRPGPGRTAPCARGRQHRRVRSTAAARVVTRSGEQGRVRAGVPGRRVSFARGAVDRLLLLDR
ncbi:hypothetical protein, partial [Streptomyces clavuligerus]|uniref:hypothetical protein n=1 Tax=Streptomyces clavuligerus TaxID=1901 RepID=UPI001E49A268